MKIKRLFYHFNIRYILILLFFFTTIFAFKYFKVIKNESYETYVTREKNNDEILLVSACYDIGNVAKYGFTRQPKDYYKLMKNYFYIKNHLVFYSDNETILDYMKSIRRNLPTTLIYLDRKELLGFKHIDEIKHIFTLPGFGKFFLETANYKYAAIVNSKVDFLKRTIKLFSDKFSYIAWIDAGYLRDEKFSEEVLLTKSKYIDDTRVSISIVVPFGDYSIESIFKGALMWIPGGFYIGQINLIYEFCEAYEKFFHELLSMKLIATDEQVLYAMFTTEGLKLRSDSVKLNIFHCNYFGLISLLTNVSTSTPCHSIYD